MRTLAVVGILILGAAYVACAVTADDARTTFQKLLYDRVDAQWYGRLQAHKEDAVLGTVHVLVTLTRDGRIRDLRVTSNTANQLMAKLAVEAVRHAKLPSPPAILVKNGTFEADLSFKVFPN